MEIPIIPITDPEKQFEIVGDFCTAWDDNSAELWWTITCHDALHYYLDKFCTSEEASLLDAEISAKAKSEE